MAFMDLAEHEKFMSVVNSVRGCKTPNCTGKLFPVELKSVGLGGSLSITYGCDGCQLQSATFTTSSASEISLCVQVTFIISGCTHATYYKTLKHALGIEAVSMPLFMRTIKLMFLIVQEMLDEVCQLAKQEMKEVDGDKLGLWTHAVTAADGVWHTRGWHSKNATFRNRNYLTGARGWHSKNATFRNRNYLTGALLYYMHIR